jgi:hypothetical protein
MKNKVVTGFQVEQRQGKRLAHALGANPESGIARSCCFEFISRLGGINRPLRQNRVANRTTPETPLALRKLWHGCTLSFQGEFF